MLESLSSLTALSMYATEIPEELPGHISRGEFRNGITALCLRFPSDTFETMTSMILSLPNLKELCVEHYQVIPEGPLPTHPVTPQRPPLDSLELRGLWNGVGEALAKSRLTFSRISSDIGITDIAELLLVSSETLVELKLYGVWFLQAPRPSRDNSDRSSRCFCRCGSLYHLPTVVTCPHHSGYPVVLIEILKILWAKPVISVLFARGFQQACRGAIC